MLEGEKDYGGMGLERMEWDKKDLETGHPEVSSYWC